MAYLAFDGLKSVYVTLKMRHVTLDDVRFTILTF